MSEQHPSYYALDRLRLGDASAADRAHLEACAVCAAHLRGPREAIEPPPWLARARGARPSPRRRLWPGLSLAAAAAVLVLVALGPWSREAGAPPPEVVREKGGPAVTLYVKRGDRVFTWNGRQAVRPGDRLRLRIDGAGHRQVSVASLLSDELPPVVLHDGSLAPGATFLPVGFGVDDQGHQEVLSIILAPDRVPPAWHRAGHGEAPPSGAWRQVLVLDKERSPP